MNFEDDDFPDLLDDKVAENVFINVTNAITFLSNFFVPAMFYQSASPHFEYLVPDFVNCVIHHPLVNNNLVLVSICLLIGAALILLNYLYNG